MKGVSKMLKDATCGPSFTTRTATFQHLHKYFLFIKDLLFQRLPPV